MSESIRSILEGIFGTFLYDLLFASLVGTLLAYLRAKKEKWAAPALYGLSGFAAVFVIAFVFVGHSLLFKEQPRTTPENVEANIKAWSDSFNLGVQSFPIPNNYFYLAVTLHSGQKVAIMRPKERDQYLKFEGIWAMSPDDMAAIRKLPKPQQFRLQDAVSLELSRAKIGFGFTGDPIETIRLMRWVPITESLTKDTFIGYMDELDIDLIMAREAVIMIIDPTGELKAAADREGKH